MLQLVFTPEDLARVRVAPQVDAMWEIVLSLHQRGVRQHPCDSPYRNWAARIRSMARDQVAPAAAALYELVPPQRYVPDFVTPIPPSTSLEQGIDAVMHVPQSRLRHQTARANAKTSEPAGVSPPNVAPYPADLTIELAGRGVTLVPSFFCQGAPVTVVNRDLDPILVYPINPPLHWMVYHGPPSSGLWPSPTPPASSPPVPDCPCPRRASTPRSFATVACRPRRAKADRPYTA